MAVVPNDGHCQPISMRTSFVIFFKPALKLGFFYFRWTIHVKNSIGFLKRFVTVFKLIRINVNELYI